MTINALSLITAQSNRKPYKFDIPNSLRFNDDEYSRLTKIFSTAQTDTTKWTVSFWYKNAASDDMSDVYFFLSNSGTDSSFNYGEIGVSYGPNDVGIWNQYTVNNPWNLSNGNKFRDTNWYHFVYLYDESETNEIDRLKQYINGVRSTVTAPLGSGPSSSYQCDWCKQNYYTAIGKAYDGIQHPSHSPYPFRGYMAEFHSFDGIVLEPRDFGRTDKYGNWVPKKVTNTNYGNNGFYLDFSDATDIGADRSGNNNHFTPSGFNTSGNFDNDYSLDSPTNNYATLNGLFQNPSSKSTLSDGNLTMVTSTSGNGNVLATLPIKNSGKWYWEVEYDKADYVSIGVAKEERTITEGGTFPGSGYLGIDQYGWALQLPSTASTWTYGRLAHNVSLNDHANVSTTDVGPKYPRNGNDLITNSNKNIISVLMDADSGALDFYINGSKQDDRPAFEETKTSAITNVTNNGGSNYTWSGTASNGYHHHALYAIPSTRSLTAAELNDINTTGSVFLPGNSQVGSGAKTAVVTFSPALTPDSGSDISVEISSDGAGPSCGSVAEINGTTYANGTHTISANITTLSGYTSYNSCANGFKRVNLNPGGTANYNIFVDDEVVLTFQDSTNLSKYRVGDLVYAVQNTNHSGIISAISGNTLTIRTPNKQRDGSSTSWQQGWTITRDLNYVDFTYPLYPAFGDWYNTQAETIRVNFGQQPFKYDLPAGYAPLCTKNLPAQKFIDGTDHFRTILGSDFKKGPITDKEVISGANWTYTDLYTSGTIPDQFILDTSLNNLNSGNLIGTYSAIVEHRYEFEFDPPIPSSSIRWTRAGDLGFSDGDAIVTKADDSTVNITASEVPYSPTIGTTSTNYDIKKVFIRNRSVSGGASTANYVYFSITDTNGNKKIFYNERFKLKFNNSNNFNLFPVRSIVSTSQDATARGIVTEVDTANNTITVGVTTGNFNVGDDLALFKSQIISASQETFPSGLWWIKDRENSNQHQLVDSVRGNTIASQTPSSTKNTTYVPPTGNSVAWCWNSANPELSGFNIIEYTGDANATQAIAHGLPGTPEFIITGSQGATPGGYETFHVGCTPGKSLTIDSPAAEQTDTRYSGVDATNITYGSDYNTNGQLMIAYAWTSIPGYSAFGSYTGNGSTDGPFVYTGFKPAFVMYKNKGATSWVIQDSTRSPYNPSVDLLYPDFTQDEFIGGSTYALDLLSNGFKWKSNPATGNANGSTYIYAAFAEKPSFAKNFSSANPR